MEHPVPDQLLTRREAADHLRMSIKTLERLIANRDGPPTVRVSPGRVLFRRGDLVGWINARATQG
jgi:predicted DNA-binding transcriptional regulator AlpA